MKRIVKLISGLLFLILIGCNNKGDVVKGFRMGSSEKNWKRHLGELVKSGIIFNEEYNNYQSYLIVNGDSLLVEFKINQPYPLSGKAIYSDDSIYINGPLRSVVIDLRGDSICDSYSEFKNGSKKNVNDKRYIRSYGPRRKGNVDKIRTLLISEYGPPTYSSDSLQRAMTKKLSKELGIGLEAIFLEHILENVFYTDKWILRDFDIELHRAHPYFDSCFADSIYSNAHIAFKMKNHDLEMQRIKDSIRSTFIPNDLISITFSKPIVYGLNSGNYELEQPFTKVQRKGPEEERLITNIKFDIVYINLFNEEVFRIRNCQYELEGLGPGEAIEFHGLNGNYFGSRSYRIGGSQIMNNVEGFRYLVNNLKDFNEGGKGKVCIDVKKVVFKGGKIFE